ncbi:hypothetical protein CANARDRAFT_24730 [[Candida] arabinofermentans NRRL YB-2248]|uniref:Uncharacterized protein n=1 Tax=[Candida] arabinofermentans NRRL YB-2248 TaxID=983967 RepID=A0A1E4SWD9_9ASCO|nr:hypothetical protein CANARDRAFT_24730 [[Candida] arabinofermentans NRRL YB-2248]
MVKVLYRLSQVASFMLPLSVLLFAVYETGFGYDFIEELTFDGKKFYEYISIAEEETDPKEALAIYQGLLRGLDETDLSETHVQYVEATIGVALTLEKMGDYDRASSVYKALIESAVIELSDPKSPLVGTGKYDLLLEHAILASLRFVSLLPKERYEEAREILRRVILISEIRLVDLYPPTLPLIQGQISSTIMEHLSYPGHSADDDNKPLIIPHIEMTSKAEKKLASCQMGTWPEYTQSLLKLRMAYVDLCIEDDLLHQAYLILRDTVNMLLVSMSLSQILPEAVAKMNAISFMIAKKRGVNLDSISLADQFYKVLLQKGLESSEVIKSSVQITKLLSHSTLAAQAILKEQYPQAIMHLLQARAFAVKCNETEWLKDIDETLQSVRDKHDEN